MLRWRPIYPWYLGANHRVRPALFLLPLSFSLSLSLSLLVHVLLISLPSVTLVLRRRNKHTAVFLSTLSHHRGSEQILSVADGAVFEHGYIKNLSGNQINGSSGKHNLRNRGITNISRIIPISPIIVCDSRNIDNIVINKCSFLMDSFTFLLM